MTKKSCYGILENVFPMGDHGLREVPSACLACEDRLACMRAALETKEGFAMRDRLVDRAAESGMIGRLKRWSRKKQLDRRMKKKKKRGDRSAV